MISTHSRAHSRRGLTLVEMLVVVALTVLMMTIIAQIFQATTGAIQIARAYQEIEQDLRAVEGTIKRDLAGVTARMTPPSGPDDQGYFEYGENEFADAQGEDSDDYLAFTSTSTDGNLFYGRYLPGPSSAKLGLPLLGSPDTRARAGTTISPVVVTSDTAEVIYFLRNGNLYRRVFLVKPDLKLFHEWAFIQDGNGGGGKYAGVLPGNMPGINGLVGWQALNDISSRPAGNKQITSPLPNRPNYLTSPGQQVFDYYQTNGTLNPSEVRPQANKLSDLRNRENRAFKPRFSNDYVTINGTTISSPYPDGNPDDFMGAPVPTGGIYSNYIDDYTVTSYPNLMAKATYPKLLNLNSVVNPFLALINEPYDLVPPNSFPFPTGTPSQSYDNFSFPFIYPNAYSRTANGNVPYVSNLPAQGAIHGIAFENPSRRIQEWNHSPIDQGDNLSIPLTNPNDGSEDPSRTNNFSQTWWGFPTWREQLSPFWVDPLKRLDSQMLVSTDLKWPGAISNSLIPRGQQAYGLSWNPSTQPYGWLPVMLDYEPSSGLPVRTVSQSFPHFNKKTENLNPNPSGDGSLFLQNMQSWSTTWEDDLIATNVRSFDVKAYEPLPDIQSYVDLGYLATATGGNSITPTGTGPFAPSQTTTFTNWLQGFGHEGRMPPLSSDYRLDAQYPFIPGVGPRYLGDDDAGVIRLRRVWDTWSTEYSAVDAKTIDPLTAPPFQPAPRPSYPAPYPAPLRGIQIQIRVTDPRQERVRTITIHQDFTSKL